MPRLFFLLAAVVLITTPARAGFAITASGNRITVPAGEHGLAGATSTRVSTDTTLEITPADSKSIEAEPYTLKSDRPTGWAGGSHLKGALAGGTGVPGAVEPGSVVVTLDDGTLATQDKDYFLDEKWAGMSRVEGGRIGKESTVKISYRVGQMRIDTIAVDHAGAVTLVRGESMLTLARAPKLPAGSVAIANVFVPYHAKSIEPWQIFEIGPAFAEPTESQIAERAKLVPKTLKKLRAGQPITIVSWGDSVTANGDASSADKAFAQLFPARLSERFPKSNIAHINAGIGATTSEMRMPGFQKDVLEHHPDLVTIEFVNDMSVPEVPLRARYAEIFQRIRNAGGEPILITPHFTMPDLMKKQHPRGLETRAIVALLREIAAEHHVALADTSQRWEHLDSEGTPYITLLVNGINHPDDRGHAMFVADLVSFFPKQ